MDDYYDLGAYSRKVSTQSEEAQRWFDRGLNWLFSFNLEDAQHCFRNAAEADPDCAMAWWGLSYALGPYYNWAWEKFDETALAPALKGIYDAAQAALARRGSASGPERALIDAIARRCPSPERPADFNPWVEDYACAMRSAYRDWPRDLDVAVLFADAIMTRTPWKLWDLRSGKPAEGASTVEALAVLEGALEQVEAEGGTPHPGLLHFYIHSHGDVPASGEGAAGGRPALRPGARTPATSTTCPPMSTSSAGTITTSWCATPPRSLRTASTWRARARSTCTPTPASTMPTSSSTGRCFLGQHRTAMEAADEVVGGAARGPASHREPPHGKTSWRAICGMNDARDDPLRHVAGDHRRGRCPTIRRSLPGDHRAHPLRDRRWRTPRPATSRPRRRTGSASRRRASASPGPGSYFNNTCRDVLEIASEMASGEIEYRRGRTTMTAFVHLREAVRLEDNLPYDEPWGWMQPARHALGALLLEQGETVAQAEAVYRADLGLRPERDPRAPASRERLGAARPARSVAPAGQAAARRR